MLKYIIQYQYILKKVYTPCRKYIFENYFIFDNKKLYLFKYIRQYQLYFKQSIQSMKKYIYKKQFKILTTKNYIYSMN